MTRDSEWGGTRMKKGAIGIVKFRNLVKKWGFEVVKGYNIRINGLCVGCGGFMKKADDERLVYFNTDNLIGKVLYRTAQDIEDFGGGVNCYATFDASLNDGLERLYRWGDWHKRW